MNNLILKFVKWYVYQSFRKDNELGARDAIYEAIVSGHMDAYTEDNLPTTIDFLQESIRIAARKSYDKSVERGDIILKRLRIEDQIAQLKNQLNELR